MRAKPRASSIGKSDLSLLAIVSDMRGAAADPCKAIITCTPNMK